VLLAALCGGVLVGIGLTASRRARRGYARLERDRAAAIDQAFRRGRRAVVELAGRAAAETREAYERVGAGLPEPVAAEVEGRLPRWRPDWPPSASRGNPPRSARPIAVG